MQAKNVTDRLAQAVVKSDVRNTIRIRTANRSNKAFFIALTVSFVLVLLSICFYYKWQYAQILAAFPNKLDRYRLVDVGVPAGYETSGCIRINDDGIVSGWARRANGETGEFLWKEGKFIRVTPSNLQHTNTIPRSNDKGDIVVEVSGIFDDLREIYPRSVLKVKHGFFTFSFEIWPEESSPFFNVSASDVNNARQVVGSLCDWSSCHAFLWQGGAAVDLNTRFPRKDWTLESADSINNKGWIVGTGSRFDKSRAFLFVPIMHTTNLAQER